MTFVQFFKDIMKSLQCFTRRCPSIKSIISLPSANLVWAAFSLVALTFMALRELMLSVFVHPTLNFTRLGLPSANLVWVAFLSLH